MLNVTIVTPGSSALLNKFHDIMYKNNKNHKHSAERKKSKLPKTKFKVRHKNVKTTDYIICKENRSAITNFVEKKIK